MTISTTSVNGTTAVPNQNTAPNLLTHLNHLVPSSFGKTLLIANDNHKTPYSEAGSRIRGNLNTDCRTNTSGNKTTSKCRWQSTVPNTDSTNTTQSAPSRSSSDPTTVAVAAAITSNSAPIPTAEKAKALSALIRKARENLNNISSEHFGPTSNNDSDDESTIPDGSNSTHESSIITYSNSTVSPVQDDEDPSESSFN